MMKEVRRAGGAGFDEHDDACMKRRGKVREGSSPHFLPRAKIWTGGEGGERWGDDEEEEAEKGERGWDEAEARDHANES